MKKLLNSFLVIIVLTFVFTGLFMASLYNAEILKPVRFEYFRNPFVGFVSVLVIILILICGIGLSLYSIGIPNPSN